MKCQLMNYERVVRRVIMNEFEISVQVQVLYNIILFCSYVNVLIEFQM